MLVLSSHRVMSCGHMCGGGEEGELGGRSRGHGSLRAVDRPADSAVAPADSLWLSSGSIFSCDEYRGQIRSSGVGYTSPDGSSQAWGNLVAARFVLCQPRPAKMEGLRSLIFLGKLRSETESSAGVTDTGAQAT